MTSDPIADTCRPFCSENCNVGMNDAEARHRSSGALAVRGGPIHNPGSVQLGSLSVDAVPAARVEQHPFRGNPKVVLDVNNWLNIGRGWFVPGELVGRGFECEMTPERAEHLAEILLEAAAEARKFAGPGDAA